MTRGEQTRERGTASCPCPRCRGKTAVDRTYRPASDGSVRRRRRCKVCDYRFFTKEVPAGGV